MAYGKNMDFKFQQGTAISFIHETKHFICCLLLYFGAVNDVGLRCQRDNSRTCQLSPRFGLVRKTPKPLLIRSKCESAFFQIRKQKFYD